MSGDNAAKRALIFDFDGLILDTESAEVDIWNDLYAQVGLTFIMDAYINAIGSNSPEDFHPAILLADREGEQRSFEQIRKDFREIAYLRCGQLEAMDGVVDLIKNAKTKGYLLAVGSSAAYSWVHTHLNRLELLNAFDVIVTFDDVENAKPAPDIFLKALEKLDISAEKALVFEDSQNGVLAAHRANIRVIAVPNPITAILDFSLATAVLPSLANFNPDKYF